MPTVSRITNLYGGQIIQNNHDFFFQLKPEGKKFRIISPWYDDITLTKYSNETISVSARISPDEKDMVIHSIYHIIPHSYTYEDTEIELACSCRMDMSQGDFD